MNEKIIIILLSLIFPCLNVTAEPLKTGCAFKQEVVLSLSEVVKLTTERNSDIKISKFAVDRAKAEYIMSFSSFFPSLRAQVSGEKFKGGEILIGANPLLFERTTYRPVLSADYQISTGGKSFFIAGLYKNRYLQSKVNYDSNLQKTLLLSISAYYDWLKSFYALDSANQVLKENEIELNNYKNRFETGFVTKLELLQSNTKEGESKNLALEAENKNKITCINLITLLNLPFETNIIPESLAVDPVELFNKDIALNDIFKTAQKHRPDLIVHEYLIKEIKNELKAAYSDVFPTVSLSAYTRGIGPNFNELTNTTQGAFSINLDLLRYLGINIFGNIKEIKAKLNQELIEKEKITNQIYGEIASTFYDYKLYNNQLVYAKEKIENAKKKYEIILSKLDAGKAINQDVIKAQTDITKSVLEFQTASINNNIAQYKLLFCSGFLTPETILGTSSIKDKFVKENI
jgi:outer membrane protein